MFSALTVAAIKTGQPYQAWLVGLFISAPAAGILHWLESWMALTWPLPLAVMDLAVAWNDGGTMIEGLLEGCMAGSGNQGS